MFSTLFRKEIREQLRTSKLVILVAVLFINGLISPLLAKYTPVILGAIPDLPAGLLDSFPTPTAVDSLAQYIKNVSQFGVLLVMLMNMGSLAQEKERGTAGMMLVKPVSRTVVVLAKWLACVIIMAAGMAAAAAAMAIYTTILFNPLYWPGFVGLNLLMILFLMVYLTLAILASALAKTQGTAAWYSFAGLTVLLVISSLPWISDYMPGRLLNWGVELTMRGGENAWWAVAVAAGMIVAFLGLASLRFEREEI